MVRCLRFLQPPPAVRADLSPCAVTRAQSISDNAVSWFVVLSDGAEEEASNEDKEEAGEKEEEEEVLEA